MYFRRRKCKQLGTYHILIFLCLSTINKKIKNSSSFMLLIFLFLSFIIYFLLFFFRVSCLCYQTLCCFKQVLYYKYWIMFSTLANSFHYTSKRAMHLTIFCFIHKSDSLICWRILFFLCNFQKCCSLIVLQRLVKQKNQREEE